MDTKTWQLKDPTISAKGAKSCTLVNSPNDKVFFTLGSKIEPYANTMIKNNDARAQNPHHVSGQCERLPK